MFKHPLHIVSPHAGSLGEITSDLVEGLKTEFQVTIEGQSEPKDYETLLCHFIFPPVVRDEKFKLFKRKILIQPMDGTDIQQDYVELFNQFDLIIVPAIASKNILIANGVVVPITIIPNYYKSEMLNFDKNGSIKQIPWNKFVFYHESTFHARKGIEHLYEGYIRAFSDTQDVDKVLLVVKDMPFNLLTYDRIEKSKRDMMELQKKYHTPAKILKISQHLQWSTMQKLWNRTNAYVSLAKIEGFGIPLLRFACMGKPIITLDNPNSGYLDFLNKKNSYLIPTTQKIAIGEHMQMYTDKTTWGVPEISDVSKTMKECYQQWLNVTHRTVKPSELVRMEYKNVLKNYIDLLKRKD